MEAIILAGGLGTRLKDEVPEWPKPMAPVNGRPFLEYILDYWIGQGVSRFVLSTGYLAEKIRQHFGDAYRGVPVAYAVESAPGGTGGGLLLAARQVTRGPFLVLNGDTLFKVPLRDLLAKHGSNRAELSLALVKVPKNDRYGGVALSDTGRVVSYGSAAELVSGGVYLFDNAALVRLHKLGKDRPGADGKVSLERDLVPGLLENGAPVFGAVYDGFFIDIGVPQTYKVAGFLLKRA